MQNKIKTILMGTPEFAENIFRKIYPELISRDFEIIAVVTAPDKPTGRKQVLTPSPVKKWALEANLRVLQPDKIRKPEWVAKIKDLVPDLIILTAFGQIIPQEILDIPKHGALNIHPSLLPKYRGASPIQSVILNGETETGACLMIEREKFDIIGGFDESFPIAYNDVDCCFRLYERGYFSVMCQVVKLIHHESISRGNDNKCYKKVKRLESEKKQLYEKHPNFFQYDPFYNINLHPNGINFENVF